MKTGLLWYDGSGKTLDEKVGEAATRYKQKHGRCPDLCLVHPSALGDGQEKAKVGGVEVRVGESVLMHHFWIGVDAG